MGRPITLDDDEILRRARRVFVERGHAVRTREIAAAVGLTWGAIALRFHTKRELFERALATPGAGALEEAARCGLPELLQRLREHLGERWPAHLQRHLAGDDDGGEAERLTAWLNGVLQEHARRGAVRADLPPQALAHTVLALLVGEAAQRYVGCRHAAVGERALVELLVALLKPPVELRCKVSA